VRVVIVCPYSWTTPGGVGYHVANLAERLRTRGHEVRVLTPADGEVEPGVWSVGRSFPVPFNGSVARLAFGPRVRARVRVALRRARPDVVHVHEPFAPSVGMLALLASKQPCVATFHASAPASRAYRASALALRPLWRKIAVRIAVSEEARRTVERVFGDGVRVVPNGIDLDRFAGVPPVDPALEVVLFVGRLERRKGARLLVEAFVEVKKARPAARLVLVGEGAERAACERALPDALRGDVEFLGRLEPAELARAMGEASVVAAPSLAGESFGIVLLEAMAAGRPVVASRIPGYAAVVRDGVEGVLVPPGDTGALARALTEVLASPERARAMGAAGLARAPEFDWTRVAAEIERAYADAVASGR
jgi:phosphatidylinositol alpha-mannosyltransferase